MSQTTHHDSEILIVDDEEPNIRLLERLLLKNGFERVHSTTDPYQVETLCLDLRPDLILLDLHMPELDGIGVMQRLSRLLAADEYLPVLVLTGDVSRSSKQKVFAGGAKDFLTKPFDPEEVVARVSNLLETRRLHIELRRHNAKLEEKVRERTSALWEAISKLENAEKDLRLSQAETIHRLSIAAELRDNETSRHVERMSRYCAILAERLGEDEQRREMIRVASQMHDIGKIGVPDAILLKPGKLSEEEFEIMKRHAEIGYQILRGSRSELAKTGATIAWTHHEKVDGSGYPRGLRGEDIPKVGLIAAIADVFDALTTNRVYRKAFTLWEALSLMKEGRGSHFDGDLLDLFLDSMDLVLTTKSAFDEHTVA